MSPSSPAPGVLAARRRAAAADLQEVIRVAVFDAEYDARVAAEEPRTTVAVAELAALSTLRALSGPAGDDALRRVYEAGGLP